MQLLQEDVYTQVSPLPVWAGLHRLWSFLDGGSFPLRMLRVPGLPTGLFQLCTATHCQEAETKVGMYVCMYVE